MLNTVELATGPKCNMDRLAATILICDDDPDIRAALRRVLRGYGLVEAVSPQEALDLLKTSSFAAITSDYSMDADSDGLDLLQLVKVQYPEMIRFHHCEP
jgi:CheY-like chemotaxis protein